jgi:hypothetical protein
MTALNSGMCTAALVFSVVGMIVGFSACSAVDPHSPVACVSRDGSCFDMTINGVEIVPLSAASKELLAGYKSRFTAAKQADIYYTAWETARPISGKLSLTGRYNQRGSVWFGPESGLTEPIIFSLDGAKLKYTRSIGSSAPGDPRGVALLQERLAQDTLPAGNYIFIVGYSGRNNWDNKHVLVRVN